MSESTIARSIGRTGLRERFPARDVNPQGVVSLRIAHEEVRAASGEPDRSSERLAGGARLPDSIQARVGTIGTRDHEPSRGRKRVPSKEARQSGRVAASVT
jgi:hypothetical protein